MRGRVQGTAGCRCQMCGSVRFGAWVLVLVLLRVLWSLGAAAAGGCRC